jgi:drug/metabolite transporter (DMT)-like permease
MLGDEMENNRTMRQTYKAMLMALMAALLYGISAPVAKILLTRIPAALMAALLYLGAGLGMLVVNAVIMSRKQEPIEARLTKSELPFVIGMILLDIAAPLFLMLGLTQSTSGTVSLLNNFEIVATSMIALLFFKESLDRRMWMAIGFIVLASVILSVEDLGSFSLSLGAIFVLLASVCWGLENNCTRMLSPKNPLQIVVIKGLGSGFGALLIAYISKSYSLDVFFIVMALLLGFVAYGLSITFYISAQRYLGAARTSAYYAAAPFIGVLMSWIILKEPVTSTFILALIIMLVGTYFAVTESHQHAHRHEAVSHEHKHTHDDGHHDHEHPEVMSGEHTHVHSHTPRQHDHEHRPDMHHQHVHG